MWLTFVDTAGAAVEKLRLKPVPVFLISCDWSFWIRKTHYIMVKTKAKKFNVTIYGYSLKCTNILISYESWHLYVPNTNWRNFKVEMTSILLSSENTDILYPFIDTSEWQIIVEKNASWNHEKLIPSKWPYK